MNNKRTRLALFGACVTGLPALVWAQADPAGDIADAVTTATTTFGAVAALSVTAFVFAIVIYYARKAKK